VEEAVVRLLRNNFLECYAPEQQIAYADRVDRRFRRRKHESMNGPDGKRHLATPNEIANWQDDAVKEEKNKVAEYRAPERALKKNVKVDKRSKKAKNDEDFSLVHKTMLRIDYDRFGVIIRNELLVDCAKDRWNEGAAEITRVVLDQDLGPDSRLADAESDFIDVNRLMDKFNKQSAAVMAAGMVGAPKNTADLIKEYIDLMSGSDRHSDQKNVNAFFAADSGMYHVAYAIVGVKLRATLMMDLVRGHHGGKAARVLATVAKAHNVSEQMVSEAICSSCARLTTGPGRGDDAAQRRPPTPRQTPHDGSDRDVRGLKEPVAQTSDDDVHIGTQLLVA
jgi:DNA-directed RNA polymerase III subunit RPC3